MCIRDDGVLRCLLLWQVHLTSSCAFSFPLSFKALIFARQGLRLWMSDTRNWVPTLNVVFEFVECLGSFSNG